MPRPMSVNCCRSLSFTAVGGVSVAAFAVSSPKLAWAPVAGSDTRELAATRRATGTCHCSAAAASSMARAVAPISRRYRHWLLSEVDAPTAITPQSR
jgi:hypothetical protein